MVISGEAWPRTFIRAGKIHAAAKEFAGVGMSKLMGDNTSGNAGGGRNFVQIGAQLTKERVPGSGPGQQAAIRSRRIQSAEEAEAMDQIAGEGIDRDHTFGFQLAEGHVKGPLIQAGGVETVEGEIDGFADAHASVAEQQEEVGSEIVAA